MEKFTASIAFALLGLSLNAGASSDFSTNTLELEEPDSRHLLSLEALGRGGLYSLNYEFTLVKDLSLGAGISYIPAAPLHNDASFFVIPIFGNAYLTSGTHRWFLTGGLDFFIIPNSSSATTRSLPSGAVITEASKNEMTSPYLVVGAGYEYRFSSNFLFRATPYLFSSITGGLAFSFGLTAGHSL